VWALLDLGIEAVVGVSFADIFKSNAFQGGLLTVELSEPDIDHLMDVTKTTPGAELVVDLPTQTVSTADGDWTRSFVIDPYRKYRLERGLDDVSMTLEYLADIETFESHRIV
jgi:3-isopropylmalate/(R)-2-methylmalate dehydratase small subunit